MSESDYWISLEFRVCREFAGMQKNHLRFLWCDGFIPEKYLLNDPWPCIRGRTWICNGPTSDEWEFTLFLNHPAGSRSEIEWDMLLPPEDVTRWLAVDPLSKRIQIEPSAAVPEYPGHIKRFS